MVDILFLTTMSETTQVTATDHIHVVFRYEQFLCVFKLFNVNLIIIVQVKTGQIVAG